MSDKRRSRTEEDLERTVRALAREFKTDTVFIIGSQAVLLSWPEAPVSVKMSPEIDGYPANAKVWEIEERRGHPESASEASEHIHALSARAHISIRATAFSSMVSMKAQPSFRKDGMRGQLQKSWT